MSNSTVNCQGTKLSQCVSATCPTALLTVRGRSSVSVSPRLVQQHCSLSGDEAQSVCLRDLSSSTVNCQGTKLSQSDSATCPTALFTVRGRSSVSLSPRLVQQHCSLSGDEAQSVCLRDLSSSTVNCQGTSGDEALSVCLRDLSNSTVHCQGTKLSQSVSATCPAALLTVRGRSSVSLSPRLVQ